jgi:hypothetical protein
MVSEAVLMALRLRTPLTLSWWQPMYFHWLLTMSGCKGFRGEAVDEPVGADDDVEVPVTVLLPVVVVAVPVPVAVLDVVLDLVLDVELVVLPREA